MKKYILSIDQGTTSTRAILFDHNKKIVGCSQREGKLFYPHPGWVELDANSIWITTLAVISDVILKTKVDPSEIDSIGITNQRETTVIWDKKTGLPVYNAIVWQSRQTSEICQKWKENGYEGIIKNKTGLRIDPYFSASKIAWILENVDGARERAERGELLFGTIDSWLVWKLSGQKTHITDASNASRTLLCNIHNLNWDKELLKLLNIPKNILPEIRSTSEVYTYTAPYLFFNEKIPICSVVGDQQAALFGQRCIFPGMAKNTYGTGGFLLMNTGKDIVRSKTGLLSTVAWKMNDKVTYALEGSVFVSGSLMKYLRDQLNFFESTSETCDMAMRVKDTGGVYFVPAFVGLGAPYWRDDAKGTLVGLTFGTTKEHIVRAALEAMAYQSKDVLDAMEKDSQKKITLLKVDGGAAANDFLLQFQSNLLQCTVERFKINELTAMGAAFFAGLASGFWKDEDLDIPLDRQFTPDGDENQIKKRYKGWQKAIAACMTFDN